MAGVLDEGSASLSRGSAVPPGVFTVSALASCPLCCMISFLDEPRKLIAQNGGAGHTDSCRWDGRAVGDDPSPGFCYHTAGGVDLPPRAPTSSMGLARAPE